MTTDFEAVLWIARTGSPWRDLPLSFGNWTVPLSATAIGSKPAFPSAVRELLGEPDIRDDATIVNVHRHGQSAKPSVLALTDALGNLVRFVLCPAIASIRSAALR